MPENIKCALQKINLKCIYEIRLRVNQPITVNYLGIYKYLGWTGIVELPENALICSNIDVEECVFRASEYSVYSIEEQIKRGFLTTKTGERIGIAGEYIFEKGQPLAIRDFTSLCVRMPHIVVGCGDVIYNKCMSGKVSNLLIISPPGLGKTTILRELTRLVSDRNKLNILICDERGEIGIGGVGSTCDVFRYCDKNTAFEAGIRAMRPDMIVTDELSALDCKVVKRAIDAGVKVMASAHFESFDNLHSDFEGLFDYYVLLSVNKIGGIKRIYTKQGEVTFCSD